MIPFNLPLFLTPFVYDKSDAVVNIEKMYTKTTQASNTNLTIVLTIAICIIAFIYLNLLVLFWWVERREMIPVFRPFKTITFGFGNSQAATPSLMLFVYILITIVIILISTGLFNKLLGSIIIYIINLIQEVF